MTWSWLIWVQGCLVGVWLLNSNSSPPPFCFCFAETGTFNINDGRNANKNYLLSSDSQSDGLCGVQNRTNQPWMKTSTCRTAHTWKNMIRGSWLDVSLFSHVGKAIRDIWLVYIGSRTKIYSAAFQCVNLSKSVYNKNNTIQFNETLFYYASHTQQEIVSFCFKITFDDKKIFVADWREL